MDEQTFDRLVRSVSEELKGRGEGWQAGSPAGGYYLVDNWRVRAAEREEFLEFYVRHVADVMRDLPGFRDSRVLVAPVESSYSWHVQALYEFESDAILDSFKDAFDRALGRRIPGQNLQKVLDRMDEWVLAHEDGTLVELRR